MASMQQPRLTIRDLGYVPGGELPTGSQNSILDVPGVAIAQVTVQTTADLKPGSTATKGVTVISPRPLKDFYKPCLAGTFTFNGNGEQYVHYTRPQCHHPRRPSQYQPR